MPDAIESNGENREVLDAGNNDDGLRVDGVTQFGRRMLRQIDPRMNTLSPEVQRQVDEFSSNADVANFLKAALCQPDNPDLKVAHDVFGPLMDEHIFVPAVIMAVHFYNISQMMVSIEASKLIIERQNSSRRDKIDALRSHTKAVHTLHSIITKTMKVAGKLGYLKRNSLGTKLKAKALNDDHGNGKPETQLKSVEI